jgi:hypothetical protein
MPGAIEELLAGQQQLQRLIADIAVDTRLQAEWYTASECARLKGISHASLTQNRWMRPLGGAGTKRIARRDRWHRSVVKEWLLQSDDQLLELYGTPTDRER